ncbi:hypothetical protein ACFQ1E_13085 [Sphingomonas canadensis]|uniref:Lipoprotein n=1 Tax=Sphingomonas canadensis TaxID=1219257 RepID=A0ABW3H7X2_9SPHN|nr:hypothetical protein [Sphingomonas canadensis]MCW3837068.1 hypothetical protein [Sphingomonas canadensis]
MVRFRVCAVATLLALAGCGGNPPGGGNATQPSNAAAAESGGAVKTASAAQLGQAFAAVFGKSSPVVRVVDGSKQTTKAAQLLLVDGRAILLTTMEIADGCHACAGALGVYYLEPQGDGYRVTARYPEAISGDGWGAAPQWSLAPEFADGLIIKTEGGYMGQGYSCEGAALYRLGPKGPEAIAEIALGSSNEGAVGEDSPEAKTLSGAIAGIERNRGFTVRVTGSETFTESYVYRDGKFIRPSGESRIQC